ncbi:MAG: PAS domain-containing protein [Oscillochloridaceae bacterium]|nr:PAS domain-containing protein [Chloroflexaceae bacterium]MDW8391823.1 PAS domain-containing protein [Oscillochloridaceae bacterium]
MSPLPASGHRNANGFCLPAQSVELQASTGNRNPGDSRSEACVALRARAFEVIPQYAQAAIIITETAPFEPPGPQVIYINPTCERMTGVSAEHAVGQTLERLLGSTITSEVLLHLRRVCADGVPLRTEFITEKLDGSFLTFDLELVPVHEHESSAAFVIVYLRDVTQYRRTELERDTLIRRLRVTNEYLRSELNARQRIAAELQRSQALLQSFFDHVPIALGVQDLQGRYILANQNLLQIFDLSSPSQLLGRSLEGIAPPIVAHLNRETLEYILRTAMPVGGVYDDLTGEGTRWFTRSFPIRTDNGDIIAVGHVAMDLTEQRRHEEERLAFERGLQEAQRRESIGILAAGLAHDFNNLLTTIKGYTELLSIDLPDDSPLQENIEAILHGVRQAADLTAQMLAYAGKGRLVMKVLNLHDLVRDVVVLLEPSLTRRATLQYRFADALPCIQADASQMRQVILNLLVNAGDALGDTSGQITLETAIEDLDCARLDALILGPDLLPGRFVRLTVSDTGCGMDEATRARIFEPFFTTKAHGRGLGMAATHGIIRSHRGAIDVVSAPGRGTTIHIYLPALS